MGRKLYPLVLLSLAVLPPAGRCADVDFGEPSALQGPVGAVEPAPALTAAAVEPECPRTGSVSKGSADAGSLLHGNRLAYGEGPRYGYAISTQTMAAPAANYGTDELVCGVIRTALSLRRKDGPPLGVADMSQAGGGKLMDHFSHQSGRDVDLFFHLKDAQGKPVSVLDYVRMDERGVGKDDPSLRFDTARNLELLSVLQRELPVWVVFTDTALIRLLKAEAAQPGAPTLDFTRLEHLGAHDDHFHVRIDCSAEDRSLGCR